MFASSYGSGLLTGLEKTEEELQFCLHRAQACREARI